MALTKTQLAREIQTLLTEEEGITLPVRSIQSTLEGLAQVAAEQLADGEDFTVPGVAKVSWRYTSALKKGERFKKGQTVVGFGGIESVKDADSPPRKASVKLKATLLGQVKAVAPRSRDEVSQRDFLRGKAGKKIAARRQRSA